MRLDSFMGWAKMVDAQNNNLPAIISGRKLMKSNNQLASIRNNTDYAADYVPHIGVEQVKLVGLISANTGTLIGASNYFQESTWRGDLMSYEVHTFPVTRPLTNDFSPWIETEMREDRQGFEDFLNGINGEVISIIPHTLSGFTDSLWVVVKL